MNTVKLVCCCISLLILQKVLYAYCDKKLFMSSRFYAKTTAIDCFGNPDIVTNISCKLKAINWERTVANADVDILVPLRNISVRFELFKYTNQFRPFLINLTINACDLWSKRKSYIYANVAFDIFGKYSNMNHTCPYSGHLIARDAYMDTRYIPFNMPTGKYKFVFTFYEGWPWVYVGKIVAVISLEERRNMKGTAKKSKNMDKNISQNYFSN